MWSRFTSQILFSHYCFTRIPEEHCAASPTKDIETVKKKKKERKKKENATNILKVILCPC